MLNKVFYCSFCSGNEVLCLSKYIKSQSNRYWSAGYPMLNHEVLLHDGKVYVWSAVRIIRSIFYCETINSHLYVTHVVTIPFCEHLSDCKRQCNSSGCKHLTSVQNTILTVIL